MPKVPRAATSRVRVDPIPLVPSTPISRRLRSRAAPSYTSATTDSSRQNATTTDFDSDSEDFVKKPKAKPKTRKVTKKPKSKKMSLKSIPDTEPEESSHESDTPAKNKGISKSNSDDLDTLSDASGKGKPISKQPSKSKNDVIVKLPKKLGTKVGDNLSSQIQNQVKHQAAKLPPVQSQSSSEEYKTPESSNVTIGLSTSSEEDIPDIVQEFSTGNINFIATSAELQQIEMRERKRLLEIRRKMDDYIRKFKIEAISKTLELSKVFGDVLLCDILEQLNSPSSLDEVVDKLQSVKIEPTITKGKLTVISEDSENDLRSSDDSELLQSASEYVPKSKPKAKYSFPRPNDQGAITPPPGVHQLPTSVFNFGGDTASMASANKMVRLAKPGEVYYSERGSPIVPPLLSGRSVADSAYNQHVRGPHTIEVADFDGEKIKVDFVLRSGAPEKAKFFAEFITDVRGIAATRSTVNHNRIQPARVPVKNRKGASTATSSAANRKRP